MVIELSVFMENRPGKLEAITRILAESGINIRGISVASEGEFGVIKIIVSEPDRAYGVLRENHFTVSKRKMVMVEIKDKPGGLHDLLVLLSMNRINIEDCYGIALEEGKKAAIILEVGQLPRTEKILRGEGYTVLSDQEPG
jgi:hypothetical protein